MATKKTSKKKVSVKKQGADNSEKGMAALAKDLKKGAKKASKKKASKKKVSKKKAPSAAQKKREAKVASKKVEKKIVGKVVVGKRQMLLLNPANIVVNEGFNPRIDKGDIAELMKSIKKNGVQQPIKVRKVGKHYELVDGERRLTAVLKLALDAIPALVDEGKKTEEDLLTLALIMNDGKPLAPVEEADAFRRLIKGSWTPRQISVATGKSLRLVKDRLTLISAHPDVRAAVKSKKLSVGLALAITKKSKGDKRKQKAQAKKAAKSKAGTKKVAATLGQASLKTKLEKTVLALQNRFNKLLRIVNKGRKRKAKVPAQISSWPLYFSKHKDKEVRAAWVAGGIFASSQVLGSANVRKTTKRGRTATGKQTRQVRPR